MKRLLVFLLLCVSALGQGIIGPNGVIGPKGVIGSGSGTQTPTLIQAGPGTAACQAGAAASVTCQFTTQNNTASDTIIAFATWDNCAAGGITGAFTDSGLNTYTLGTTAQWQAGFGGLCLGQAWASETGGGGTKITITVTFTGGTPNHSEIIVSEWSHVNGASSGHDTDASSAPGAATPWVSASITTTNATDLVVACFANQAQNYNAAVSPFTVIQSNNTGTWGSGCEYNTYTTTQSGLTASATPAVSSTQWNYIMALKAQ